jgi:putative ABC transport system substrate-binding protein
MKRREFISLLSGAAATWPLLARAQQTRLPIIGFVGADATSWSPWTAAFVQRLHELGWTEGRTVAIEYHWNEGQPERIAQIAAEFIHLKVGVIVTNAIVVPILKQATTVIPIVFAIAADPVRGGLVANLARPGGNVTGQSIQSIEIAGKRLALLRETVPHLQRLAILFNADSLNPSRRRTTSRTQRVRSASKSCHLKSGERKMLPPRLRRSNLRLTHFMSLLMR